MDNLPSWMKPYDSMLSNLVFQFVGIDSTYLMLKLTFQMLGIM